ncbi:ABC transporter ATP-binding protein [Mycoplasma struthionis]|uniref:ABC transporter ATP-binding protein n=1 Tax=Mycoplasma struthionis TaxID=538220 RepID=A0A3G8LHR9_9MOLU|nr:ABC transporter ATP-binding protein [Mycoplasma struthionis]AZG68775.1 ABC transporter ATP-binding protein [Mycoplasma struthionis]TPI01545.1 ABC transporter ATP-binding protein [Mycoplasma struthionis]
MENIIEVKELRKSYGNFEAVKGISFTVKKGSLFAFLGTNGAGKSTTIDILCTLNKFNSGEVKISGIDLKTNVFEIKNKIGVVFQDSLLDKNLTIYDNLLIRAGFYYKNKKDIKAALDRVIENVSIKDILKKKYGSLSGGQRRKVDIARALINNPEILFLDEPTTGLDPQNRKHIWEIIKNLQSQNNMTIFLTTHYMEEAEKVDDVVIIDHGQIIATGTPFELRKKYSSEHIKIKYPKEFEENLKIYFDQHKLEYEIKADYFDVNINSTKDSLTLLKPIENYIDSFEVLYGTMDDVFLNITGRMIE